MREFNIEEMIQEINDNLIIDELIKYLENDNAFANRAFLKPIDPFKIVEMLNIEINEAIFKDLNEDAISCAICFDEIDNKARMYINSKQSYIDKRFDVARMLAYYLIHFKEKDKLDMIFLQNKHGLNVLDIDILRINKFATNLLVPSKEFKRFTYNMRGIHFYAGNSIKDLAVIFGVSKNVIKHKLHLLVEDM
jgi:Zn-dependent peptidase ImmA (M78 family)